MDIEDPPQRPKRKFDVIEDIDDESGIDTGPRTAKRGPIIVRRGPRKTESTEAELREMAATRRLMDRLRNSKQYKATGKWSAKETRAEETARHIAHHKKYGFYTNKNQAVSKRQKKTQKKKPMARKRRRYSRANSILIDPIARRDMIIEQAGINGRGSEQSRTKYGPSWSNANADQRRARMITGFRGRGDYGSWKPWLQRWVPKGSLSALGAWAGGALGGPAGGLAGGALGSAASGYLGWGKYRRKNYRGHGAYGGSAGGNQIMAGSVETPMVVNASDDLSGDLYFSHREFIGNVTALGTGSTTPSAFSLLSYPLNPGLSQSFPWISQIAQNFAMYEPMGIIYEYVPTSGELGSASNALGKVVMATQYDPDAPAFTSTVQMENYDYANACKPSEHMLHGVETASRSRATEMLYVRTGASTKDKLFTDVGTFQIATEGLPVNVASGTTVNIGELWVSYRFRFSRAQLYNSLLANNIGFDSFISGTNGTNLVGNTATFLSTNVFTQFVQPYSTFMAARMSNNIGCEVYLGATPNQQLIIRWPENIVTGQYRITFQVTTAGAWTQTFTDPTMTFASYVVSNGIDYAPFAPTFKTAQTFAGAGFASQSLVIQVTSPGTSRATLTLGISASLPTASVCAVTIHEMPVRAIYNYAV